MDIQTKRIISSSIPEWGDKWDNKWDNTIADTHRGIRFGIGIITLIIIILSLYYPQLYGQQLTPSTLNLSANIPPSPQVSVARNCFTPGNNSYYYWVISTFPRGNSSPSTPQLVTNLGTLSAGTCSVNINWVSMTSATSHIILRTTTSFLPNNGSGNILLASGVAGNSYVDDGSVVPSAYTINTANSTTWLQQLNNINYPYPIVTFSSFPITPSLMGTGDPNGVYNCVTGQEFFQTDATPGNNKWLCTSTNVFTQITGGGGGASTLLMPIRVVTAGTDTILNTDQNKLIDYQGISNKTVTIPTITASFPDGWYTTLRNTGTGDVTATSAVSGLNGVVGGSFLLPQGYSIVLQSSGAIEGWKTLYFTRISDGTGVNSSLDPVSGIQTMNADMDMVTIPFNNDGVTGTILNSLVVVNSSGNALRAATSTTEKVVGVAINNAGTAGTVTVQKEGRVLLNSDGNTTIGNYVGISSSTAGSASDLGASCPTSGQVIGVWDQTAVGAGLRYAILGVNCPQTSGGGGSSYTTFMETDFCAVSGSLVTPWSQDTFSGFSNVTIAPTDANTNCGVSATTGAVDNEFDGFTVNAEVLKFNNFAVGKATRITLRVGTGVISGELYARADGPTDFGSGPQASPNNTVGFFRNVGGNILVQHCVATVCGTTDTGVALAANTEYEFILEIPQAGLWNWSIATSVGAPYSIIASGTHAGSYPTAVGLRPRITQRADGAVATQTIARRYKIEKN